MHLYVMIRAIDAGKGTGQKIKHTRAFLVCFIMEEIIQCNGADYEARTRYLHLGKVALYQMS